MPRRNDAVFKITGTGVTKAERNQLLRSVERGITERVRYEFVPHLGRDAVKILKRYAPKWTGRLQEGIHVTHIGASRAKPSVSVGVTAVSDEGFPYVAASRYGRRAIEAKGRSTAARSYRSPPGGVTEGGQRRPFRARMLSFEHTQTVDNIYRRRVRAHRPSGDWVTKAEPEIRVAGKEAFEVVAEVIQEDIERVSFITGKPTGRGAGRHPTTVRRIRTR
jgi:hypothetical protein